MTSQKESLSCVGMDVLEGMSSSQESDVVRSI